MAKTVAAAASKAVRESMIFFPVIVGSGLEGWRGAHNFPLSRLCREFFPK
jgi:hypothetical protein